MTNALAQLIKKNLNYVFSFIQELIAILLFKVMTMGH